jgi:hypothetical protein
MRGFRFLIGNKLLDSYKNFKESRFLRHGRGQAARHLARGLNFKGFAARAMDQSRRSCGE